jgi:hypothetical protein
MAKRKITSTKSEILKNHFTLRIVWYSLATRSIPIASNTPPRE